MLYFLMIQKIQKMLLTTIYNMNHQTEWKAIGSHTRAWEKFSPVGMYFTLIVESRSPVILMLETLWIVLKLRKKVIWDISIYLNNMLLNLEIQIMNLQYRVLIRKLLTLKCIFHQTGTHTWNLKMMMDVSLGSSSQWVAFKKNLIVKRKEV